MKSSGFMSYAHLDDGYGSVTKLRNLLSQEVSVQLGETFEIFQDRKHIAWGQNWEGEIEGYINEVTFLIPVISPGFFKSLNCRDELERFLEREKYIGRNDLVLPIYYVDTPILSDKTNREEDPLAQAIADHQYTDWRELRIMDWESPTVWKALRNLAVQVRDATERVKSQLEPMEVDKEVNIQLPEKLHDQAHMKNDLVGTVGTTQLGSLISNWDQIIRELKKHRQALTAAVYEEALIERFDGERLEVTFSEENSFYVGMANDEKHTKVLRAVIKDYYGFAPDIEVKPPKLTTVNLRSKWKQIMQELKKRRHGLTAAIYEEASIDHFDGNSLEISFPEEQSFYVGMASEVKHVTSLVEIIKDYSGSEPHVIVSVRGESS